MIFKYLKKNFLINFFVILFIFLLDRATKIYVIYLDTKNLGDQLFSSKFLNIDLIWNQGVAFGLFAFTKSDLYHYLTGFIGLVIIFILYMIFKSVDFKKYFLLLIAGGALGNFYDRIYFSAVPDFIDFHIDSFHWFTFNIADLFITLGVIFMILYDFTDINKKKINEKN